MIPGDVNYLAILVAAIASIAIGAVWYSPMGFGKQWSTLMGWGDPRKMEEMKKGAGQAYLISFVAQLIMAYVLAHVVQMFQATTFGQGLVTGFWMWLGFIATTSLGIIIWEQKPPKLFVINNAYQLVSTAVMAAILAMWV